MRLPQGFRAAGISAGLKKSGKPDLGLIVGEGPLAWSLLSTTNVVHAACVARNRELHADGAGVRALIVNSGNANCSTGRQGELDNERMAEVIAALLGDASGDSAAASPGSAAPGPDSSAADPGSVPAPGTAAVLTASTGVVGQRMPIDGIADAAATLYAALDEDSAAFARAILTTDLVDKQVEAVLPGGARVVGVAKGSGMIHPNMATMLAFVMTDAAISQGDLRALWRDVAVRTFNQVTVDGDTSPNDMAVVLSSGRVPAEPADLRAALLAVCEDLARKIARDGEGATKLITVRVTGANSDEEARLAARTVAGSSLTKAAVHGRDPNWGRIVVALGRSGASFDPEACSVALQGITVYRGAPQPFDRVEASRLLGDENVFIDIDLGAGEGSGNAWGCDLTAEYVRINADYTT